MPYISSCLLITTADTGRPAHIRQKKDLPADYDGRGRSQDNKFLIKKFFQKYEN